MLKIRLARFGKKNDPFYRVVAIDKQKKREGESVQKLGFWHPRTNLLQIDKKSIAEWTTKGAIVSEAVKKLIK